MSTSSGAGGITFDKGREQWPVFWCSLLSPLLYGAIPRKKAGRFLSQLASTEHVFPNGRRAKPSRATLWRKWKQYRDGGFNALSRKRRCDQGKLRKATQAMITRAVELKKEHPRWCDTTINQFLRSEFGKTIPKATLYCHLKRAGATSLKLGISHTVETDRQRWDREQKWMTRLGQGKLTVEEVVAKASQELKPEHAQTLLNGIHQRPTHYRTRAIAALAYHTDVRITSVTTFLGVSRASVYRWAREVKRGEIHNLLYADKAHYKNRKVENDLYTDAVFEILHAPPSTYGINRTTWRLSDISVVMVKRGLPISRSGISRIVENAGYTYRKAKRVLTSTDPEYKEKLREITRILANLGPREKFFSVDEFGPFSVKMQGGRSLTPPGEAKTFPQYQRSKGSLIITAALELSTNQITHFYSPAKNTAEMVKLLDILVAKYADQECIYFSWDAASWHASKALYARVDEINNMKGLPQVKLAPLPSSAQFLNVIESVFSGMARAVLHNSNYESVDACKKAIDQHFEERNQHFTENPKRAGNKIWGKEPTRAEFSESNNCKAPEASW